MSETTIREGGFSVSTTIDATPETLYDAWTTKAGVEGWLATTAEVDARVSGRYVFSFPMPGGDFSARGEYLELVPGKKVVMTWESWGPNGRFEDGDATVQVEFTDLGNGSTEMLQTEWSPAYEERSAIDRSVGGTIQAHEALARFVQPRDAEQGEPES